MALWTRCPARDHGYAGATAICRILAGTGSTESLANRSLRPLRCGSASRRSTVMARAQATSAASVRPMAVNPGGPHGYHNNFWIRYGQSHHLSMPRSDQALRLGRRGSPIPSTPLSGWTRRAGSKIPASPRPPDQPVAARALRSGAGAPRRRTSRRCPWKRSAFFRPGLPRPAVRLGRAGCRPWARVKAAIAVIHPDHAGRRRHAGCLSTPRRRRVRPAPPGVGEKWTRDHHDDSFTLTGVAARDRQSP